MIYKSIPFCLALIFISLNQSLVYSQIIGPRSEFVSETISQNSISNLATYGDTVWIGPQLQRNIGRSTQWFIPENIDSILIGNGRVYSLALKQDTIFAGIGRTSDLDGQTIDEAFGFYFSEDGGDTFEFISYQVEDLDQVTYTYGGNTITQLPVVVRQQSPPYMVDRKGDVFFAAAWATGLLRSLDGGQTQERIIIPPSNEDSLVPEKTYNFDFNPRNDTNFLGFSVLIDSKNRVWFGTAGGLNMSPNAMYAPKDSVKWYHYTFNSVNPNSLPGNWIIYLTQQPGTNRLWMTNWVAQTGESYGISYTEDDGKHFVRFLDGEKIYAITFYHNWIIASGENGVFYSKDDGISWNQIKAIRSPNQLISSKAKYFSASANNDGVWIGSSEGLIFTSDFENFEITRVNFPLSGGNAFDSEGRTTKTYAYPNPFSNNRHTYCRIVFESKTTNSDIKITVYDFAMTKIRELNGTSSTSGVYEAIWDGLDHQGRLVANGVVFYTIEANGEKANGKILVID